jgi:hypothetical protein
MGHSNDQSDWATELVVAAISLAFIAVLALLRIVVVWQIGIFRRHHQHAVLWWAVAGWGLCLLLALPLASAWPAAVGTLAFLATTAISDVVLDAEPQALPDEVTVEHLLAGRWHDDTEAGE